MSDSLPSGPEEIHGDPLDRRELFRRTAGQFVLSQSNALEKFVLPLPDEHPQPPHVEAVRPYLEITMPEAIKTMECARKRLPEVCKNAPPQQWYALVGDLANHNQESPENIIVDELFERIAAHCGMAFGQKVRAGLTTHIPKEEWSLFELRFFGATWEEDASDEQQLQSDRWKWVYTNQSFHWIIEAINTLIPYSADRLLQLDDRDMAMILELVGEDSGCFSEALQWTVQTSAAHWASLQGIIRDWKLRESLRQTSGNPPEETIAQKNTLIAELLRNVIAAKEQFEG